MTLARGRAVREALKQPQFDPLPASVQIAILVAATAGLFDNLTAEQVATASGSIRERLGEAWSELIRRIEAGDKLSPADRETLASLAKEAIACKPPNR